MVVKNLLLGLFLAVILGLPQASFAKTFTFWPEHDAWVNEANPDVNYGSNTYFSVKDRSDIAETYLKFSDSDLNQLRGLNINSASLNLFQYQATYSFGDTINAHKVNSVWDEGSLTWNSKPGFETQSSAFLGFSDGNNVWREWYGLENCVASWLTGPNYGLVLENHCDGIDNELFARFYSSEFPLLENRPFLRVTTTPEPLSATLFLLGGASMLLRNYFPKI